MIAAIVYGLCALTSVLCAVLLIKSYLRTRFRLLFWSSIFFVAMVVSNGLLFLDLVMLPQVDLAIPRAFAALAGVVLFLYGLIMDGGELL